MAQNINTAVDEDSALLQFPKEFENAETLLISEVRHTVKQCYACHQINLNSVSGQHVVEIS